MSGRVRPEPGRYACFSTTPPSESRTARCGCASPADDASMDDAADQRRRQPRRMPTPRNRRTLAAGPDRRAREPSRSSRQRPSAKPVERPMLDAEQLAEIDRRNAEMRMECSSDGCRGEARTCAHARPADPDAAGGATAMPRRFDESLTRRRLALQPKPTGRKRAIDRSALCLPRRAQLAMR